MAEVTGFRNNALPYPVYGVPWAVVFPMLDADGDLVSAATTPDAEVSKNGDTFADCTNESTEIATNSGVYYLLLTGTEMTADIVAVIAKSATAGMKTTVLTFYPRKLVSLRAATSAGGAAGSITLDASANATDDYYNGCLCVAVIDGNTEARIITDYTGSSKVAAVTPNWNVAPDSDDTFTIYLPEGRQMNQADLVNIVGAAVSTTTAQLGVNAVQAGGTVWGSGAITAASVATGAIDADALAADAGTEIGTAVWATAARSLTVLDEDSTTLDLDATIRAALGLGAANLDTQLDALPTAAENSAAVWGAVARTLTALDEDSTLFDIDATIRAALGMGAANFDTQIDALPTAAENADAVWDEATAGHAGAGTTGKALTDAGGGGGGTDIPTRRLVRGLVSREDP